MLGRRNSSSLGLDNEDRSGARQTLFDQGFLVKAVRNGDGWPFQPNLLEVLTELSFHSQFVLCQDNATSANAQIISKLKLLSLATVTPLSFH